RQQDVEQGCAYAVEPRGCDSLDEDEQVAPLAAWPTATAVEGGGRPCRSTRQLDGVVAESGPQRPHRRELAHRPMVEAGCRRDGVPVVDAQPMAVGSTTRRSCQIPTPTSTKNTSTALDEAAPPWAEWRMTSTAERSSVPHSATTSYRPGSRSPTGSRTPKRPSASDCVVTGGESATHNVTSTSGSQPLPEAVVWPPGG